jgi:DMSO/TMAO reductase YedYZ molybdopterin-dependent catalytic subunit
MEKRYRGVLGLVLVVLLASGAACNRGLNERAAKLAAVQVSGYKGEKLGSIDDFRENSIKGPQTIDIDTYRLDVSGLVDTPRAYTYQQVLAHPRYSKVVVLNCVEGWSVKILWEGILIKDLLAEAGVKPDAVTVIFHGYEGYTTSLPLAYVVDRQIMLAHMMNGLVLPAERGFPFQVVAEDKLGYKWAKWVTRIELSGDPTYKGYWESRGYDNDAGL